MDRRVAVTGIGLLTALGKNAETSWQNILAGKNGIRRINAFDPSDLPVQIAGEVPDFDPAERIDFKKAKRMDRFCQFAVWTAHEAVSDSGFDFTSENPERSGVLVGVGIGGIKIWEKELEKFLTLGPKRVSPMLIPMMIPDMASGFISIEYGICGPNFCTVSACASGAHAIGTSFGLIKQGKADIMITGGTEAATTPCSVAAFANMRAISRRNDDPEHASRPFDADRDGFVMAEGSGIIVLEELEHARKRGANIYAELVGYGLSGDAFHMTAPDPQGRGPQLAMRMALEEAGLNAEDVDYVNAHGTSTELNDPMETMAIHKVFGQHAEELWISSTKSMIGHLLGGAGGAEAVVSVLSIRDGKVHPTRNLSKPGEGCDLDYVPGQARQKDINVVISNSFGFGGHNVTLAFKRFEG
ncbi:beta-ketoacyl-ACP synthase II [candidate division WOR-3 bacterium]|uniref:3-oxoacyl-[acyl-carrier-protein] synthase 2 n=1 Tax=candidate division WOR-3 bacterium TaxID=2052148 RepID=A0A9D5KC15_UNCW3|nr:beta-ketoacyl-ACP synthase II [candidate division WOR-3 bacterium]MBD3365404.1 beta-ketoacyl-ACP synthase II [candidate division WOR-3 bacterium]